MGGGHKGRYQQNFERQEHQRGRATAFRRHDPGSEDGFVQDRPVHTHSHVRNVFKTIPVLARRRRRCEKPIWHYSTNRNFHHHRLRFRSVIGWLLASGAAGSWRRGFWSFFLLFYYSPG